MWGGFGAYGIAGLCEIGLTDGQALAAVTQQAKGQAYLPAPTELLDISAILCLIWPALPGLRDDRNRCLIQSLPTELRLKHLSNSG